MTFFGRGFLSAKFDDKKTISFPRHSIKATKCLIVFSHWSDDLSDYLWEHGSSVITQTHISLISTAFVPSASVGLLIPLALCLLTLLRFWSKEYAITRIRPHSILFSATFQPWGLWLKTSIDAFKGGKTYMKHDKFSPKTYFPTRFGNEFFFCSIAILFCERAWCHLSRSLSYYIRIYWPDYHSLERDPKHEHDPKHESRRRNLLSQRSKWI